MRPLAPTVTAALSIAVLMGASLAGCTGAQAATPAIEVTELEGPFDPLSIRIVGLDPGAPVTLAATTTVDWTVHRSASSFEADAEGVVDLGRDVPTDGAWSTPDPMAPFWSLESRGGLVWWDHFDAEHTVELAVLDGAVDVDAIAGAAELASASIVRGAAEASTVVETVDDAGLPAVFAVPGDLDERAPRPAVLVMGGSEGGIRTARTAAAQLARLGYPALAVSLFGSPGQSDALAEVPIDGLIDAIEWLRAQPGVDSDRVTTFGVSRGGELALWLAAEHPALVSGAIQAAGAGELWSGYPDVSRSGWTFGGAPLPFTNRFDDPDPASIIDVTAIDGPVVLACGTADPVWPACPLQRRTLERLEAAHVAANAVETEGAGHLVALAPYVPALEGADGAADSAARVAFWRAVIEALGPTD